MNISKKSTVVKLIALLLVMVFVCPIGAIAAEPRASDYLSMYSAYVYPAGWGKVQVWFSVDGTGYMDEIGALEVYLFESKDNENWTQVAFFQHPDDAGMLGYDNHYHTSHVEYQGTIGRYYKAYVCVWAGKDGDGDTRYFWTSPKKATLFAA